MYVSIYRSIYICCIAYAFIRSSTPILSFPPTSSYNLIQTCNPTRTCTYISWKKSHVHIWYVNIHNTQCTMHVHVHVHIRVFAVCIRVQHIYIHVYIYIKSYACIYMYIQIPLISLLHTHVHVHVHVYIYACVHGSIYSIFT